MFARILSTTVAILITIALGYAIYDKGKIVLVSAVLGIITVTAWIFAAAYNSETGYIEL